MPQGHWTRGASSSSAPWSPSLHAWSSSVTSWAERSVTVANIDPLPFSPGRWGTVKDLKREQFSLTADDEYVSSRTDEALELCDRSGRWRLSRGGLPGGLDGRQQQA